jgi:hypothetical protein
VCYNCGTSCKSKYCNNVCQKEAQHKEKVRSWLAGELVILVKRSSSLTIRKFLIEQSGEKCSLCGWSERHPITGKVPVELDHIDGNSSNNLPSNVRLLCPNCHSLTPTFRALNRGKGRVGRK